MVSVYTEIVLRLPSVFAVNQRTTKTEDFIAQNKAGSFRIQASGYAGKVSQRLRPCGREFPLPHHFPARFLHPLQTPAVRSVAHRRGFYMESYASVCAGEPQTAHGPPSLWTRGFTPGFDQTSSRLLHPGLRVYSAAPAPFPPFERRAVQAPGSCGKSAPLRFF